MGDIAEILMTEHACIRHIRDNFTLEDNGDLFVDFVDYLKLCHIEIEEKVLVPVLKEILDGDKLVFSKTVERIMADHRLLETLAQNIIKWREGPNFDIVKERSPLFFKLLVEHNNSEEVSIFPNWKNIDPIQDRDTVSQSKSIIESFGIRRYERITGISVEFLDYIFH